MQILYIVQEGYSVYIVLDLIGFILDIDKQPSVIAGTDVHGIHPGHVADVVYEFDFGINIAHVTVRNRAGFGVYIDKAVMIHVF